MGRTADAECVESTVIAEVEQSPDSPQNKEGAWKSSRPTAIKAPARWSDMMEEMPSTPSPVLPRRQSSFTSEDTAQPQLFYALAPAYAIQADGGMMMQQALAGQQVMFDPASGQTYVACQWAMAYAPGTTPTSSGMEETDDKVPMKHQLSRDGSETTCGSASCDSAENSWELSEESVAAPDSSKSAEQTPEAKRHPKSREWPTPSQEAPEARKAPAKAEPKSFTYTEPDYTTVMLRNIPNKYTREMLVKQLEQDMKGQFDFVYLPIDFKNKCNVGYAFINFSSVEVCSSFVKKFNGVEVRKCLPGLNSRKIAEVTPARIQGREENVRRLRNSPVMGELAHHPEWMPLIFDANGEVEVFPVADQPLPPVKPRRHLREDKHEK